VRAELVACAIERGRERGAVAEVIVVGDTIHDISAARACQATVVAVTTGADPADKLAHADAVMTSLAELPAWHAQRFG
jgi:phosphoglycolate phosphatase-like HAD superfamily hydrolase